MLFRELIRKLILRQAKYLLKLSYMVQRTRTYSLAVEFHRVEESYRLLSCAPRLPQLVKSYQGVLGHADEALLGFLEALAKSGKKDGR